MTRGLGGLRIHDFMVALLTDGGAAILLESPGNPD